MAHATYSFGPALAAPQVEIIANAQGHRTTPSYVAFTESERLIGDGAKNQVALNPKNTVFDAKRLIGRKFTDKMVQVYIAWGGPGVGAGARPRVHPCARPDARATPPRLVRATCRTGRSKWWRWRTTSRRWR